MDPVAQIRKKSLADSAILSRAILDSFRKLNPRTMVKNPVMFVVEVGAVLTTIQLAWNASHHTGQFGFGLQITLWLWFTVLFANFAEGMAEGRGKAQADTLRKARAETQAHRLRSDGSTETVVSSQLRSGDIVVVTACEFIPGDGEVIEGVASVDESAITGESAPVIRESGGDRSAVTGGTRVLSDEIKVKITSNPGETFLDRMIKLVEGASRQKTPNEIALNILLAGLTIIFLFVRPASKIFSAITGGPDHHFFVGGGHASAVRDLFRRAPEHFRARFSSGVFDSYNNRGSALGDRDCGNGPSHSAKRHRDVRAGRRSFGRRGCFVAR